MSAPPAKRRRSSAKPSRKPASSTSAATVHESMTPGGWFLPHESQPEIPVGGVDAGAGVIGIPLSTELLCPGGNFEMAMRNVVGSRENRCLMNLFAWLVEAAHSVGLTCYMETVVDADMLEATNWPTVLRCRLFVPVPTSSVEALLDRMRQLLKATLTEGEVIEDASSRNSFTGRASPAGQTSSGGWTSAARHPASYENIDSVAALLAALQVAVGRPRDDRRSGDQVDFAVPGGVSLTADRSNLLFGDDPDDDDTSAAISAALGAEPIDEEVDTSLYEGAASFSSRSPMMLLRAEHMFADDLLAWDRKHGAHEHQLNIARYLRDGRLMFPEMARVPRGSLPPLVTVLPPHLDGRIGSADELLNFNWPLSQAPVSMLVTQCRTTLQYSCVELPSELEHAATVTDVSDALRTMSESHSRGIMVRPELIFAPDFPHRSEAPAAYRHPFEKIWPIQSASMQRTSALLSVAATAFAEELLSAEKTRQIFERQLVSGLIMMITATDGVDPTFCRLAQDLTELATFVETGKNAAADASRAFFANMATQSPVTEEFPDRRDMPLLSQILAQKTALIRGYLNISAAQVEAFVPIEASGHGMGGDDFGQLQQTWLLKGPYDVGKSYVLDVLGTCVPPSMWHQSHHTTAGSRTIAEFRGYYMADEQQTNTTQAGKGRGAASTNSDRDRLSMMGSGWYGIKRLVFDPKRDGKDISRLEEAALDKRQICVAAGNGMYDQPFESRCTVKLMARNAKTTSSSHPDRRELTLSAGRDSPGREATSTFLRYCMALSNRMWVPYAAGCVRRFDTTMTEIFYGLTVKYLVPAGFADMECRPLAMMKRQARSYAVMRLSTQWERLSELTMKQRDAGRDMFFLSNCVVQAQDVLQAYFDITGLTDTRKEEAEILATLKSRIVFETTYGHVPKEAPTNGSHYVTNIRGFEGLAEACPKLGDSIIQSVLPKLQFSSGSGDAKVAVERDRDYRNCLTISKAAADNASCLTKAQELVVKFLTDKIITPAASGARQWYPEVKENGEETGSIVFRSSVLQAIKGGAALQGARQPSVFRSCSQEMRQIALVMFERAGLMAFNPDAGGEGDRSAKVANPIASLPGVTRKADRLGLLDGLTALKQAPGYQAFYGAAADEDPDSGDIAEWLSELPTTDPTRPKRLPRERPNISILDLHGVLVVRPKLMQVIRAVQVAKCQACNVQAPPGANQHEVMESALQTLIDALFAISGEAAPGMDVYCGASVSAAEGIKWRRIGEFAGSVTIKNPRRRQVMNAALMPGSELLEDVADDDSATSILPADKKTVTFAAGANITKRLLAETRKINVPFADPSVSYEPRAATPPPVIRPHRDVVGGRVGAAEHRVTESGGLVMRPVAALRTEEDNEFSTFF